MTRRDLDLDFVPEPPASASVLAARWRRALVVGLGGGRTSDVPMAKSSFAERRVRGPDAAAARVEARPRPAVAGAASASASVSASASAPRASATLRLDGALVVPAGALVRGYLRCRALLLAGEMVGNIHCTAGPVVIRAGARLQGRLVAAGDVYVCGRVGDSGGGAVIVTRGKLTLAPGARVDGDVRSGWLDLYDGAMLHGLAKGCED